MESMGNTEIEQSKMAALLRNYLRVAGNSSASDGRHLDEDSISSFVDGSLTKREALPIVNHLVDCSFCRIVTAELVKLDYAFADEAPAPAIETSAPTSISEILSGILGKIFGKNDGVVFAHQESDEDQERPDAGNDHQED